MTQVTAVTAVKQIVRDTDGVADREALAMHDPLHQLVAASADAAEGVAAFVQRRTPRWRGL